jgi:hypothetical protein
MIIKGATVISAQYANEDKTEICLFTEERGAVILSKADQDAWEKLLSSNIKIKDMDKAISAERVQILYNIESIEKKAIRALLENDAKWLAIRKSEIEFERQKLADLK